MSESGAGDLYTTITVSLPERDGKSVPDEQKSGVRDARIAAMAILSGLPEKEGRCLSEGLSVTIERLVDFNLWVITVEYSSGPRIVLLLYQVYDFGTRKFTSCLFQAAVELGLWGERRLELDREGLTFIKERGVLPYAIIPQKAYEEAVVTATEAGVLSRGRIARL